SDTPLFPFHIVIGKSITSITVPVTPLPGQSALFGSVYETVKDGLFASPYQLELDEMAFYFDDETKNMILVVTVKQDESFFYLQYLYRYTINTSNIASFVLELTN